MPAADGNKRDKNRVRELARECYRAKDGNWDAAARLMRQRIENDPELFKELMDPMLDEAIWYTIRKLAHEQRSLFTASIKNAGIDNTDGLRAMAQSELQRWLDFPLSGGLKLGDADRDKLREEAAQREEYAKRNEQFASFFREIAKRIDGKIVRQALNEKQLEKIWEKFS